VIQVVHGDEETLAWRQARAPRGEPRKAKQTEQTQEGFHNVSGLAELIQSSLMARVLLEIGLTHPAGFDLSPRRKRS